MDKDSGSPIPACCTIDADGMTVAVKASPKASRDQIGGIVDTGEGRMALAVRIAAPPVDGEANGALTRFLAKALGVARGDVTLRTGSSSRLKLVRIAGDGPALAARLAALAKE